MSEKKTCGGCRFFRVQKAYPTGGTCYFNPPTVNLYRHANGEIQWDNERPYVSVDDFCGRHEDRLT